MPDGFSARLAALGRDELARVLARLCDAVEAAESSALVPADRDHLAFLASTNPALASGVAPSVPIGASFTGLAFRSGQTIALADAAHQPGHFKGVDALVDTPTREFAAVPMLDARGTVVGVLTLANRRAAPSPRAGQPFSPDDLAEAARTATDVAGGIALLATLDRVGGDEGAARDPDLSAEIAALGERDRRSVRALVAALVEMGVQTMPMVEHASALRALADLDRLHAALRESRGRGIKVAVLDSGVDGTHPRLAGRIAGQFDVVEGRGGARCVAAPAIDMIGHGTACAGIVAELAPEAEITSVRVFGAEAKSSTDALVAALTFALDRGFDVINMSLGTTSAASQARLSALADRAFYEGRIIVAAANNFGHVAYPAHLSSVVAVGMEDFADAEAVRYAWTDPIEVGARGIYVEAPAPGGGTQLFTGTSFACPHVSGLVARLASAFPGLAAFEARCLLALLARTPAAAAAA